MKNFAELTEQRSIKKFKINDSKQLEQKKKVRNLIKLLSSKMNVKSRKS